MDTERIKLTIDVDKMQNSHVTIIGGAYGLASDLVRCNLGSLTMVDFDTIDRTNVSRQDFYSEDIGRLKVEAIASTLKRINPEVEVDFWDRDFCSLTRNEVDELLGRTDLLLSAADEFTCQARANFEAIRLGIPAEWIGLYEKGRAGEIIYYVPQATACYRCICGSRYKAFESDKSTVNITSEGGTILDLRLVDSIAGQVAVGILTRGSDNRMGQLIGQLGNRNLLQVKIDPTYRLGDKDIFGHYLGNHPANFSFTTIALPMEREEGCPDCKACNLSNPTEQDLSGPKVNKVKLE